MCFGICGPNQHKDTLTTLMMSLLTSGWVASLAFRNMSRVMWPCSLNPSSISSSHPRPKESLAHLWMMVIMMAMMVIMSCWR